MNINYTTVYKISFALIISLSTYMAILSKSKVVNICIVVGISVLLAVCGAIVETVINDSLELKSIMNMFDELFCIRSCTINTSPESYDLDSVDFVFDGCDKEQTKQTINVLSEILSNVYVVGCGRFNYCQFYVDNDIELYKKIVYVSSMVKIDANIVVSVPAYNKYDITMWVYDIMLYSYNGYKIAVKYNKESDTHFACVVSKN